jgi:HEAT repeat protein
MGDAGRVAFPDLAQRFKSSPGDRDALMNVFKKLPSRDFLFAWLDGLDPVKDSEEMFELLRIPRLYGAERVRFLCKLLPQAKPSIQQQALHLLEAEGAAAGEGAVPTLRTLLTSPDPEVRYLSVRILGSLGPAAGSCVPELERAAREDSHGLVRSASERAIGRIQGTRD